MASPAPSQSITSSQIPNLRDKIPKLEPRKRRQGPANPTPVPETPSLPPPLDLASHTFKTPTRRILSKKDHDAFLASSTYKLVVAWVFTLAESVTDKPQSAVKDEQLSGNVKAIITILEEAERFVQESPPDEQGGSRFGNKAFYGFVDRVKDKGPSWHRDLLHIDNPDAVAEVSAYLNQSFGNRNRIDYGSGHELNFVIWLLCLYQLNVVTRADFPALVLRVFTKYLSLMRTVQMTYYLEPAGSHGVWGLDDYQFMPFLFGAAQLLHHPFVTPRAVHQDLTIEEFGPEFMYLGQVGFVNSTKTVRGLRWHSPMLDDISSAKSWSKIEGGMRRMFVAEVLGKLPVAQHFMFGSLVFAVDGMSEGDVAAEDDGEHAGHSHEHGEDQGSHDGTGWGDCCGIKVPSSIAAAQEMKKAGGAQALRRIPFD